MLLTDSLVRIFPPRIAYTASSTAMSPMIVPRFAPLTSMSPEPPGFGIIDCRSCRCEQTQLDMRTWRHSTSSIVTSERKILSLSSTCRSRSPEQRMGTFRKRYGDNQIRVDASYLIFCVTAIRLDRDVETVDGNFSIAFPSDRYDSCHR